MWPYFVVLVLFLMGVGIWLSWTTKKDCFAFQALLEEIDTSRSLLRWRLANPDLYIGDTAYTRELVLRRIQARKRFLEAHPFINDDGFLNFLLTLLDEHGPEPPRKRSSVTNKPPRRVGRFCSSTKR